MLHSRRIPCVLMRGGTSRGPFFLVSDLPSDIPERDAILLAAMGSGHELQVDGIGGGNPLTSKVAIVGPPTAPGADVDYLFAQVKVREQSVATSPNCGNMLSGVGPFAIESGLVTAGLGVTIVRIHNINTGKIIEARVATPGGRVTYDGDVAIDGVPGTAAPVHLAFLDAAGSKTGKLLPTGEAVDCIGGIDITQVSYVASARKSILSILYGSQVSNGVIKLESTLAELGIEDIDAMLPIEKTATVRQILTATSGVYHPSNSPGDGGDRPVRGSVKPRSQFFYNN